MFRPNLYEVGPLADGTHQRLHCLHSNFFAVEPCALQLVLIRVYSVRLNHARNVS